MGGHESHSAGENLGDTVGVHREVHEHADEREDEKECVVVVQHERQQGRGRRVPPFRHRCEASHNPGVAPSNFNFFPGVIFPIAV